MANTTTGGLSTGIKWFIGITSFVVVGVGVYALYKYVTIQNINKTVVTPQDAMTLINQAIAQPA